MKRRVLVPFDGSALSDAILPVLTRLLQPDHHQLSLLMILAAEATPTVSSDAAGVASAKDVSSARRASLQQSHNQHESLEHHLLQLQRRLEVEGFQVTTEIDRGDPAEGIISRAHEVDLIAMATHGRSGLGRLLLGSVAETVLKQSHVPVLMFNPPPRLAEETLPQHSLAVS